MPTATEPGHDSPFSVPPADGLFAQRIEDLWCHTATKAGGRSFRCIEPRRTKIVCTLGPACDSPEGIRDLLRAGATVFRFNFSHGSHASHTETLQRLRQEAQGEGVSIAVMQDLCGPKIRIHFVADDELQLKRDQRVRITTSSRLEQFSGEMELATDYEPLLVDLRVGDTLLIDDGRVELRVTEHRGTHLETQVVREGMVIRGKGLNMPGVALSTPSITDKDWRNLEWGIDHDVDYVALSFVRAAEDLLPILEHLEGCGSAAKVVAKIERPEALENIHGILRNCDAVMVARGDLGLEIDFADVPRVQKQLIDLCRRQGKPVITATQLLDSMVRHSTPTRAEVSDVANAVFDGTDAIMLSNETAAGMHPTRAAEVLARVAVSSEAVARPVARLDAGSGDDDSALADTAARLAVKVNARRIVVATDDGDAARMMARYRLPIPIVAITPVTATCRQLALSYGVEPVQLPAMPTLDGILESIDAWAEERGWGVPGERLLVLGGYAVGDVLLDTVHVHTLR